MRFDIIGDIHGACSTLEALLTALGYRASRGVWRHPARRVLFLGDYIDRGPRIRDTLHLVRNMVDAGEATALLGNHELNAIAYHTPDGRGGHLRAQTKANRTQHEATLRAFAQHPAEWTEWLEWFKQLPLFFDTATLRAVHASWCEASVRQLEGSSLRDPDFLQKATQGDTPEMRAVELLLKGPELDLKPYGLVIEHPGDRIRDKLRVKWWDYQDRIYRLPEVALTLPPGVSLEPKAVDPRHLEGVPNVALGGPPIFCGHYNLLYAGRAEMLAPGICCLDYGAGRGGFLAAYRWEGERDLDTKKVVFEPEQPGPN